MRPNIKKTIVWILTVLTFLSNCIISYAISTPIEFLAHDLIYEDGTWSRYSGDTWTYSVNNNLVTNKFFTSDSKWYLTNIEGFMVTGFVKYHDKFYYFMRTDDERNGSLAVQKTFKTNRGYYSTTKSGRVLKSNDKIESFEPYYDFELKSMVDKSNYHIIFDTEITEPGLYRTPEDDIYGYISIYGKNGKEIVPAVGIHVFDDYYYIFDENGKARTGVTKYGEDLYYCLPIGERKGIIALGSFNEDGKTYTTDSMGKIVSIR